MGVIACALSLCLYFIWLIKSNVKENFAIISFVILIVFWSAYFVLGGV